MIPIDDETVRKYADAIERGELTNEATREVAEQAARGEGLSRLDGLTQPRLADLCKAVRTKAEFGMQKTPWEKQSEWQQSAHGYRITLVYQSRRMSLDFWQGMAHTESPDAEDVLECLLADASSADQTFERWCAEMGYDSDSRRAESIYQAVQKQTAALRRLLGDDFETFMESDRN